MCALRELYEETNLLVTEGNLNNDIHFDVYNKNYKSHFIEFC